MSSDGANAGMETSAPLINAIVRVYNEAKNVNSHVFRILNKNVKIMTCIVSETTQSVFV